MKPTTREMCETLQALTDGWVAAGACRSCVGRPLILLGGMIAAHGFDKHELGQQIVDGQSYSADTAQCELNQAEKAPRYLCLGVARVH
jgi:hypothetical protein